MEFDIDYADIRNQIYRQEMDRTFEFNLMIVGRTGVGKSTLVKSLFEGKISPERPVGEAKLNEYEELLEENGVKLKLHCIETSNFKSHNSKTYSEYIDEQMRSYFRSELRQAEDDIHDTRVHCCIYMIEPYGKMRLEEEDIECMKAIHEKVNLVPIIAKADSFTLSEITNFKENVLSDLRTHGIQFYKFTFDEKEDEDRALLVKPLAERFPFAVIAVGEPTEENGRRRWIRTQASGKIDIYDDRYDFNALSKLMIRHCMLNLIDDTHIKLYTKFEQDLLDLARLKGYEETLASAAIGLEPWEAAYVGHLRGDDPIELGPLTPREKPAKQEKPAYLRDLLSKAK